MRNEPIFIVGVARSGTTLLAAMLAAHSRLSCGPETHIFRWLPKADIAQICSKENWPALAVDFVHSLSHPIRGSDPVYIIDKYQIEIQQIRDYLEKNEPSVASLLASITEPYRLRMGKARWIEKTPNHLEHVHLIRKYFPRSPIVRIVRDPRDVALSLTKVPWGMETFLEGLLHWKRLDETSYRFFAIDSNSYTLRFEDLILSPESELSHLCQFLGEEFEEEMLDTADTGKQLNSRNAVWKDKVRQPVDVSRISVWRNELTKQENQLAEAIVGDRLEAYGYPREEAFLHLTNIYPTYSLITEYATDIQQIAAKGIRFWRTQSNEIPTARVYLGNPGDDIWLSGRRIDKVARTLVIAQDIVRTKLLSKPLFWIPKSGKEEWSGWCAFVLKRLLAPHRCV